VVILSRPHHKNSARTTKTRLGPSHGHAVVGSVHYEDAGGGPGCTNYGADTATPPNRQEVGSCRRGPSVFFNAIRSILEKFGAI